MIYAEPPPQYRGVELTQLATRQRIVALTLDCGGNSVGAWEDVRTLLRKHARATFFFTGRFVREYPQLARVAASDFAIANHTDSHPQMTRLSDAQVRYEVAHAEESIERTTGKDPQPLFRFPYGDSNARVVRDVNRLGYISIRWTVDTLGWMGRVQSVDGAVRRVVANLRPGAIVLMHVGAARDGATVDEHALARVIDAVRAHGYHLVTLASRLRPGSPPRS